MNTQKDNIIKINILNEKCTAKQNIRSVMLNVYVIMFIIDGSNYLYKRKYSMEIKDSKVKSVAKAFHLLDVLAKQKHAVTLIEIAQLTGWPKSTIHALLSTMLDYSVIAQDPQNGKYRLGMRLFELGCEISSNWNILEVALPFMQNIMLETGESVNLGTLDKGDLLLLERVDSGNPLRVMMDRGMRLPLHSTAMGKAIVAFLSPTQQKRILQEDQLQVYTPHTITQPEKLETELEQVRLKGFALENGEMRVGMRGIAAPIFDYQGNVSYALGITGMFRRISEDSFLFARDLVVESCQQISRELGFPG